MERPISKCIFCGESLYLSLFFHLVRDCYPILDAMHQPSKSFPYWSGDNPVRGICGICQEMMEAMYKPKPEMIPFLPVKWQTERARGDLYRYLELEDYWMGQNV